jgi:hypothetical protein
MTEDEAKKNPAVIGYGPHRGLASEIIMSLAMQGPQIFSYETMDAPRRYPQDPGQMVRLRRSQNSGIKGTKEAARRLRQIQRGILKVQP